MPQLGPLEILVVLVVALLVFGPKRLPEVGRQVGHGLRELRKIQDTVRAEIHEVLNAPDTPSATDDRPTFATSGTPAPLHGRPAPSRFRPPITSVVTPAALEASTAGRTTASEAESPNGTSDLGSAQPSTAAAGHRAPSRFRAPGR